VTTWNLPSTTRELVGPITVAVGGTPVVDFDVAFVPAFEAPSVWEAPTVVGGEAYVLVGADTPHPLARGEYGVWVRFESDPEAPVVKVGTVKVA
jgi:hypothetical protein